MADQMQAIKRRMKSVSSTERITNAMKLVSAAKLKQATNRYTYVQKNLGQVTNQFLASIEQGKGTSVYCEEREGKTLYLLLTGSKGLCGSYNSSVMKEAEEIVKTGKDVCFLPLGTKGKEFLIREEMEQFQLEDTMEGLATILDEPVDAWSYAQIREICGQILEKYRDGEITGVGLISTVYVNSISHAVKEINLFPLQANSDDTSGITVSDLMEYEPNDESFFHGLAEEYLALKVYRAIAEATLCEHSARRMAMKNASDNAKEMLTELSIYYNRARQAAITNEIIEIIAGSEAQKTGK